MIRTAHTASETETVKLGTDLGRTLRVGDVVLLTGTLGAGKTAFVRGLAAGLGADPDAVSSPTFTIAQEYAGPITLQHVDLYRLMPVEVDDLGLDDLMAGAVLAVSHGAIFARLSAAAPLVTSAWRLTLAAAVVLPIALLFGRQRFQATARDWCLAVIAGGLLALHFATWITSIEYTSIANSVLLVITSPVWVGLVSLATGAERPGRALWVLRYCWHWPARP